MQTLGDFAAHVRTVELMYRHVHVVQTPKGSEICASNESASNHDLDSVGLLALSWLR